MLVGIIKNKDNSYEYLNLIDNNLYCSHLDSNGFSKSDILYIKKVFKELFYSRDEVLLGNYNNYEVYYDKLNNIKHYVRDGRENFNLFFEYNGYNGILNKSGLFKSILTTASKVFITFSCTFIISSSISACLCNSNKDDFYIEDYFNNIYSAEEIASFNSMGIVNDELAIKYIQESNLDDDLKKLLMNNDLLEDIFSYYNGTPLLYSANLKFRDINIDYFDTLEENQGGYYNELTPNTIHISGKYKANDVYRNEIIAHEYIHLLQAEGCPYRYLKEACAELLAKEYFNFQVLTYKPAVKNLMLLIDIIGPEPVIELLFGGNSSKFTNILENNLDKDAYNILIDMLQNPSLVNEHYEENKNIQELLCILYKNIYGKDIRRDDNIHYDLVYDNDDYDCTILNKYYLNVRKMTDNDSYEIIVDKNSNKDLFKEKYVYKYQKNISYDEYKLLNNDNYSFEFVYDSKSGYIMGNKDNIIFYKYINNDIKGYYITVEDACNSGLISIIATKEEDSKKVDDWKLVSNECKYVCSNDSINVSKMDVNNYLLSINSLSIKSRFSDQYNNIMNKYNGEIIGYKLSK